jgi:hypothetical protein
MKMSATRAILRSATGAVEVEGSWRFSARATEPSVRRTRLHRRSFLLLKTLLENMGDSQLYYELDRGPLLK